MFVLRIFVKNEINGIEQIRRLEPGTKINEINGCSPLDIEITCKDEINKNSLEFKYNVSNERIHFFIQFNFGFPGSERRLSSSLTRDARISRDNFNQIFLEFVNNLISFEPKLVKQNGLFECINALRECMGFPKIESTFEPARQFHYSKKRNFLNPNTSIPDEKRESDIRQRFNDLESTIQRFSLGTPKVGHGIFSGHLPRNLREMNSVLDKIKNHQCTMKQGLENIIRIAERMGNQHPILVMANKCHGMISYDLENRSAKHGR